MGQIDFSPLWVTLKTGIVASVFSFFIGIAFAELVINTKGRVRAFWDGLLTLPMVLPPTVAGYILLRIFSTRRPFGSFLSHSMGIQVVHTWLGCVVAATIIALPLMYRNARAAFEQIDENVIYAARTLGISEWKIFWKIRLPMAKPGIISGVTLAFARAIGACRKYSRKNLDNITADSNGRPKRRLCHSGLLVHSNHSDFVCMPCINKYDMRQKQGHKEKEKK
jgi:molybdate transport system permease protein